MASKDDQGANRSPAKDQDHSPDDPGDDPMSTSDLPDDRDYACHFYKRDHIKYGPWNKKYSMCSSSRITRLRDIK
jgi:hypothetical protein